MSTRRHRKTRDAQKVTAVLAGVVFGLPALLALPTITSLAVLHSWWPTIPTMTFWTAYGWHLAVTVTTLPAVAVIWYLKEVFR